MLYFPSLKYLHLHENNLLQLPPHIGYQKNLETLDISDNKNLKQLPKELGNLKVTAPDWLKMAVCIKCVSVCFGVASIQELGGH